MTRGLFITYLPLSQLTRLTTTLKSIFKVANLTLVDSEIVFISTFVFQH